MKRNKIGRVALGVVRKFAPKVQSVRDADDDLMVEVTSKDEKASRRKDHGECAMAVALKRQEHAAQVIISARTAYLIKGTEAVRYKVPEAIGREVVSFDRGSRFEPGDYKLKAMPKCQRLGAWQERSNPGHGGPTVKTGGAAKRFIHHTANIRDGLKTKA